MMMVVVLYTAMPIKIVTYKPDVKSHIFSAICS